MKVPSKLQLDKDEAYRNLLDEIANALIHARNEAVLIAAIAKDAIGESTVAFMDAYSISSVDDFYNTVIEDLGMVLPFPFGLPTLKKCIQFHKKRLKDGKTVEEIVAEYRSWRRIIKYYLTEGEGCNQTSSVSGDTDHLTPPSPSLSYLSWLKQQPCIICQGKPVDPAHFPSHRGWGYKAKDDECIPLCREHHRKADDMGRETFYLTYKREVMRYFCRAFEQGIERISVGDIGVYKQLYDFLKQIYSLGGNDGTNS